jgi:hypothetical protein
MAANSDKKSLSTTLAKKTGNNDNTQCNQTAKTFVIHPITAAGQPVNEKPL